jgi:hypothetical protein
LYLLDLSVAISSLGLSSPPASSAPHRRGPWRQDEFGYAAVENKVHVHDLHATILHLLGIDHERQTFRYSGRDFRLPDVNGHVVRDILA